MRRRLGDKLIVLLIGLSLLLPANVASVDARPASPIDPALAVQLARQPAGQRTSVIVILADQFDAKTVTGRDRAERQKKLILTLRQKTETTQLGLRALLQSWRSQGRVQSFTPLWIVNAIALTADSAVVNEIAQLPQVGRIVPDSTILAPAPLAAGASEPNLNVINAPALWSLGYQGQGVVVANMDTGVDVTHPDLAARWRGGSNSWYDPYGQHPTTPTDRSGHGTQTMGLIVGGSNGGTAIGVAPQARWIAVKIFNDAGSATTTAIHQGFQWLLDPDGNPATADAPGVVNNSWTFNSPGCFLDFEADLQALVAAGITPVFAAGNYGPNASTSASPSNNPSAFSVGATDNTDLIASFSSRGPTTCTTNAFPSVVAPGVNVKTSDLFSLYVSVSGTSFSAPHVTGALALLLSAFPNLTVAQQESALTSTAHDLGAAGPDSVYGAGRIDVLAAYNSLVGSAPNPIFSDGFEAGDLSAWSSAATGGRRLSVTAQAALAGSFGMQAVVSGATPIYVVDTSPSAEPSYHARFYFSINGVMPNGAGHDLFVGRSASGLQVFRVQFRRSAGSYQVRALLRDNSGNNPSTSWYALSNASHVVEIAWQAASTPTGADGSLSLWLDGTLEQTRSAVANGALRLEEVRLGATGGISFGTSGTEFFDAFASTRATYIGP